MKRKILIVTTSDRMAGAEKNMYDLVRLLDKDSYEVRVAVFKHEPDGQLMDKVRALGIPVDYLGIQSKWQVFRLVRLWKIIREFRPNILESFLYFDNQVCRILGRLARVPLVVSGLQNVETKQSLLRRIVDRLTVRLADVTISNTETGKEFYVRSLGLPPERVQVARGGIDIAGLRDLQAKHARTNPRVIFDTTVPEGYFAFLAVGFLTEQKGMTYLLQSLKLLKDRGRKVMCFIIGTGKLEAELKREAEELGVTDCAHFVGYQAASYQYLPLFDLFVLPSLWEGLPNVVIEALASGTPVVATDVGGMRELITDGITGFLVQPADPVLFAGAVERALDLLPGERDRMCDAARRHIESSFTVDSMVASYVACYEHLLQESA